ncbi:hypothetical protein ACWD5R_23290 [Streptomyces sp. NPDC002514]|uniref:hypothetical protein n=1 Tax=unclassified Streptomyces TaxID=2593676 RepID=UPI0036C7E1B3
MRTEPPGSRTTGAPTGAVPSCRFPHLMEGDVMEYETGGPDRHRQRRAGRA